MAARWKTRLAPPAMITDGSEWFKSQNTPTISQTEWNNNGSVWFMRPDEDFQIHAKHAKNCWTNAENILRDWQPVGLKYLFLFFSSISCASACLSGPKHPFHQAHTDKFEVHYQLAVRLFKRHSNICKDMFLNSGDKKGLKSSGWYVWTRDECSFCKSFITCERQ